MDIEKLALDTNEEMGSEINSVLSEENKLTLGNANTKGFLLDESDVLLFQKELNSKATSDETSILSENKNLFSQEAEIINPQKLLFKEKELSNEKSISKGNSPVEKNINITTIPGIKKHNDKGNNPVEKNNITTIPGIKKHNDKDHFQSVESSIGNLDKNIFVSGEYLAIEEQDKHFNLANKSTHTEKIKTNEIAYEIKSMPLEISIEPTNATNVESAKLQTTPTVENVVRTHAEIISQQIKDQIIDRILVSTNDLELNKTVKIVISPSLLENTSVNFQKIGQNLSIQFETINVNSLKFLKANQVDLQLYLQENLKQFQDVSVRIKGSSQNFEQPQDGRSRNRYEYENLDDEEQ